MNLLRRIIDVIGALAGVVKKAVNSTAAELRMSREQARDLGKARLIDAARHKGHTLDINSVHDVLEFVRDALGPDTELSGDFEFRKGLAEEMRIENYKGTAAQNDLIREELFVMIGYGDLPVEK